jgi:hypothetical protein
MPLFLLDEEKQKVSTEPVFLVETKWKKNPHN